MKTRILTISTAVLLGIGFQSCEKDVTEPRNNDSVNKQKELNTKSIAHSYTQIEDATIGTLDDIYADHSIAVFCACNCSSFATGQNQINDHLPQYSGFADIPDFVIDCTTYTDDAKICGLTQSEVLTKLDARLTEMIDLGKLSSDGKQLIVNLANEAFIDPTNIDYGNYRTQALAITTDPFNNTAVDYTIHFSEAASNYYDDLAYLPPNTDEDVFLANKIVGGIIGGFVSAIIETVDAEVVEGGSMTGGRFGEAFGKGFLGGAITSI